MLSEHITSLEIEKKKRGRKRKIDILPSEELDIKQLKRGRKPTNKLLDADSNNTIIEVIRSEQYEECLVVKLKLDKNDIISIIGGSFEPEKIREIHEPFPIIQRGLVNNDNVDCTNCNSLQKKIDELELKYKICKLTNDEKRLVNLNIHIEDIYVGSRNVNNISCWWCCHEFDTLPIGLPDKYIENIFYVIGYFCSFNCALAHNMSLNDHHVWDRTSLLYLLRNKICMNIQSNKNLDQNDIGTILGDIVVSAPKYVLKKFGGNTEIDDYRFKSFVLKKQYRPILPQTLSIPIRIEESTYDSDKTVKQKHVKHDSQYVLRRNK